MSAGFDYLIPPVLSPDDPNLQIATCDLDHIKYFLCPVSGGNPVFCMSCSGFKTCPAGQRAMVLLKEAKKKPPEYEMQAPVWKEEQAAMEQKVEPEKEKPVPKETTPTENATQKDKLHFEQACESGNARGYLLGQGYSEAAAQEKLVFWCKHYPSIVKVYGKERIMRKAKKIVVTSLGGEPKSAEPEVEVTAGNGQDLVQNEPEGAAAPKGKETIAEDPQEPEGAKLEKSAADAKEGPQPAPEGDIVSLADWLQLFPEFAEESTEATEEKTESAENSAGISEIPELEPPESVKVEPEPVKVSELSLSGLLRREAELLDQIAELYDQLEAVRAERRKVEGR